MSKSKKRVWPGDDPDKYYLVDRPSPDIAVVLATGSLMDMAKEMEVLLQMQKEQKEILVNDGQIELSERLNLKLEVWPCQLNLFDKIENF